MKIIPFNIKNVIPFYFTGIVIDILLLIKYHSDIFIDIFIYPHILLLAFLVIEYCINDNKSRNVIIRMSADLIAYVMVVSYLYVIKDVKELAFLIPYVVFMQMIFNVYLIKNKIFDNLIVIIIVIYSSIFVYNIFIDWRNNIAINVYGIVMSFAVVKFHKDFLKKMTWYENAIDTAEKRIGSLLSKQRTIASVKELILHDVNNVFTSFGAIPYWVKAEGSVVLLNKVRERFESSKYRIMEKFRIIGELKSVSKIKVSSVAVDIFHKKDPGQDLGTIQIENMNDDKFIEWDIVRFYMIMENLIDNAIEAYKRKSNNIDELKIIVVNHGKNTVSITDNAGGKFKRSDIKLGNSSKKGNGHGKFLDLLFHQSKSMGVKCKISSTETGISILIKFLKNK